MGETIINQDMGETVTGVAYLGPEGSYSHILATQLFDPDQYDLQPMGNMQEIHDLVMQDEGHVGILPVHNNMSSTVHNVVDYIYDGDYAILGEAWLKIRLHLMGLEGSSVEDVKHVVSHEKALGQARHYLDEFEWEREEVASTSAAGEQVSIGSDTTQACLGSLALTERYPNLTILQPNVVDPNANRTRMLVVSSSQHPLHTEAINGKEADKATMLLRTSNDRLALANVLQRIGRAGGNLTQLESRPVPLEPDHHQFWLDVRVDKDGKRVMKRAPRLSSIIRAAEREAEQVTVLGRYPTGKIYDSEPTAA